MYGSLRSRVVADENAYLDLQAPVLAVHSVERMRKNAVAISVPEMLVRFGMAAVGRASLGPR